MQPNWAVLFGADESQRVGLAPEEQTALSELCTALHSGCSEGYLRRIIHAKTNPLSTCFKELPMVNSFSTSVTVLSHL